MNNQDTDKYTVILDRCGELCVSFRTGSAGHEGRIRREDISQCNRHVRFTPKSGQVQCN